MKGLIVIFLFLCSVLYAQDGRNSVLAALLPKAQFELIQKYNHDFETVRSAKRFHTFYKNMSPLKITISRQMDSLIANKVISVDSAIHIVKNELPYLKYNPVEEGLPFYLVFNNDVLTKKAANTKGTKDDRYMDIMSDMYGIYGEPNPYAFPEWVHKRSHVSISSPLGDGTVSGNYKRISEEKNKNRLFEKELELVLDNLKKDLTGAGAFDYSKDSVVAELKKIAEYDLSLREAIENYIRQFDLYPSVYRFGCNFRNCNFEE